MENSIKKITLGIRHRRMFRVSALAGAIMDEILRDRSGPFVDKFTNVANTVKGAGKILLRLDGDEGEEPTLSLAVDMDNLVFSTEVKNLETELSLIEKNYIPYFKDKIYKAYEIDEISRLGIVFHHKIDKVVLADRFVKFLSNEKLSDANEFELRFTKKLPTIEGRAKKDIVDFYNVIVSIAKQEEILNLNLDYQMYFSPTIANIEDVPFNDFISSAKDFLKNNFYLWNHGETQSTL